MLDWPARLHYRYSRSYWTCSIEIVCGISNRRSEPPGASALLAWLVNEWKDYPVPDQSPPRRRFRLLRWSLFGLALVGLGFLLNNRLPARPRCTIASATPVFIDSL